MAKIKKKKLSDISWNISEEEYRNDPALSYSLISKFQRGGFESVSTLYDKVESPALTFGSLVDCMLLGNSKEFTETYYVADIPEINEKVKKIVDIIMSLLPSDFNGSLGDVNDNTILYACNQMDWYSNLKDDTRVKKIKDGGYIYFLELRDAGNRTVISNELFTQAANCVNALKESENTRFYFAMDNAFDEIERYYQLKFKGDYLGIPLRIMIDECIVDYENKTIRMVDLKTTGSPEYKFPESFIKWLYVYQCEIYHYILTQNIEKDPYFKDFTILDGYHDVVINKDSLTPLVWEYPVNGTDEDFVFGNKVIPNWRKVVCDLHHYLTSNERVPVGISLDKPNNINDYFKDEHLY